MSGYKVSVGYGNVAAGEYDFTFLPTVQRDGLGVVGCHGSGHPYLFNDPAHTQAIKLGARIASAGIPIVTAEFGGQAWGNDEAMAGITAAIDHLAEKAGTSTTQVLLLGGSMGGFTALRYAMENPSKVAAVVGLMPLTNMTYFYSNNVGGAQAEVAGAWGVTAPAALPSGSQVQENAASITMPIRIYYSSTDSLIRPVDTTAFAAAAPNADAINVGTRGHSDLTVEDAQNVGAGSALDIINFLKQNGA